MRRLMLLRHAKSDWPSGVIDRGRPLAERGRRAAPLMGAYIARHALQPDRVLVSPARRSQETWELAARPLSDSPDPMVEERLYDASTNAMLDVVREQPDSCHLLLLVGHNPSLQDFALHLIATGEAEARQRVFEKYPTGGLTVIDFAIDSWNDLRPLSGRLDRFVVPRMLGSVAD